MLEETPPSGRLRVCGAILRGDTILMVQHRQEGRTYWTLPGGGVEANETALQAVVREVHEETGLNATVERFLFSEGYEHGLCECYLLKVDEAEEPVLGYDPEETALRAEERMLRQVAWKSIALLCDDAQVVQVLRSMSA